MAQEFVDQKGYPIRNTVAYLESNSRVPYDRHYYKGIRDNPPPLQSPSRGGDCAINSLLKVEFALVRFLSEGITYWTGLLRGITYWTGLLRVEFDSRMLIFLVKGIAYSLTGLLRVEVTHYHLLVRH